MYSASGKPQVQKRQLMVKRGQNLVEPYIDPVIFSHSRHPGLGLEVLSLADLRRRVPARHHTSFSRPEFHQLVLVEAGETEHQIDFTHYRSHAGSVLHLRPGQIQRFVRDDGAEGVAVLFRADFLPAESALRRFFSPLHGTAIDLPPNAVATVGAVLRALAAVHDGLLPGEIRPAQVHVLQHLLVALLLQINDEDESLQASETAQTPHGLQLYRRFLEALEANFASSREVAGYARRIGCSTKTLTRVCLAVAGASPKELIERRVMLEAKRLIEHSMLTVSAISVALGFSEPTNFVKFFKRAERMTPSAWRAWPAKWRAD